MTGFTEWAKANPNEFYPLYIKARVARPMPEPEGDGEERITIVIQASEPRTQPASPSQAASTQLTQANTQAEDSNRVNH